MGKDRKEIEQIRMNLKRKVHKEKDLQNKMDNRQSRLERILRDRLTEKDKGIKNMYVNRYVHKEID